MNKQSSFLLLSFLLLFPACKNFNDLKDVEIVSGNAEFAIPLVTAKTSLQDILENFDEKTIIEIDPDGLIRLKYFGDVVTRRSDEILADAVSSIPSVIPVTDTLFELPFSSPEELEVDLAVLKSGSLQYGYVYQGDEAVDLTISLPQVQKEGEALVLPTLHMNGASTLPPGLVPPIDLTDYHLVPDENGSLFVRYHAITASGERIKLSLVTINLNALEFSYIEGFLGNHIQEGGRDTIAIEFFENWIQGDVRFEEPLIKINIENSFGIPTRSIINVFQIQTTDGQTLELQSDFINNNGVDGIDFAFPSLAEVGETAFMSFPFDKSNSNIVEVLSSRPIALDYDVDALTNPDTLTEIRGFLTDSSFYRVQVEVELPTYGAASDFVALDTFDLDLSSYDNVEQTEFKIITDNGTPLNIDVQVFFADENGVVLDSLLDNSLQQLVAAAPVNGEGIVIERTSKETLAPFSGERFNKIRSSSQLILRAAFSTINDGQTPVKMFNDQEIEIRMGMKIKTN